MTVRLSSRGQLVIPRSIRQALGLEAGTEVEVHVEGNRIILDPIRTISPIDRLYGKFAGLDLLSELEAQHRQELNDEPSLGS